MKNRPYYYLLISVFGILVFLLKQPICSYLDVPIWTAAPIGFLSFAFGVIMALVKLGVSTHHR
jgi:hypothetical protein